MTDAEMIAQLQKRGYVIRHKSEAREPLSWNRTMPFPDGVDFKAEAVEKLREQVTADILDFETRHLHSGHSIATATLRVLR